MIVPARLSRTISDQQTVLERHERTIARMTVVQTVVAVIGTIAGIITTIFIIIIANRQADISQRQADLEEAKVANRYHVLLSTRPSNALENSKGSFTTILPDGIEVERLQGETVINAVRTIQNIQLLAGRPPLDTSSPDVECEVRINDWFQQIEPGEVGLRQDPRYNTIAAHAHYIAPNGMEVMMTAGLTYIEVEYYDVLNKPKTDILVTSGVGHNAQTLDSWAVTRAASPPIVRYFPDEPIPLTGMERDRMTPECRGLVR